LLFAGCLSLDAVVSRGGALPAGGELSLAAERDGADGAGDCGGGAAGRLLSTSAPKSPLACAEGSGSAGLGGATCRDALAATSDVTLNTGGRPFAMNRQGVSKERASARLEKIQVITML
jgi:hypothetical protein